MAIHVALTHRTTYEYDRPTTLGPHVVRLRPAPHTRTPILQYSLRVQPEDHFLNWQQDPFGNWQGRLVFPEPSEVLELVVDLVADMTAINPFDFFVDPEAEHVGFEYDADLRRDLSPYLHVDEPGPLLAEWLADRTRDLTADPERRTLDLLVELNQRLQSDIAYTTRMEPGVQTPEETLEKQLGSCRDSGWLMVQVMRHLGLAARFASGYLVQLRPDQESLDGPSGAAEDFTDLHAWAEAYLPGAGWVGMDPTSGLFAGEGHIPLACTPEPRSAAPVEGITSKAEVTFSHANLVARIHEDPRVTAPYAPEQVAAIHAVGALVDRELEDGDVRLTQGGEPTFVSIDAMGTPEWTIAADGHHKRERAWDLSQRLFDRFADGGVIHHGQGKWYPGEPLPRWQTQLVWRRDGEPVWRDPTRLADPWTPGSATRADAEAVADGIAEAFGVPRDNLHRGWEDELHRLWRQATLPEGPPPEVDVDPADDRLVEPDERRRLLDALDAADGEPVGTAIPLHHDGTGWASARWSFRRGRMVLLPGDSPMGLRLPLPGLSWGDPPPAPEPAALAARGWLPDRDQLGRPGPGRAPGPVPVADAGAASHPPTQPMAPAGDRPSGWARTTAAGDAGPLLQDAPARPVALDGVPFSAVCVELRDGRIHVFCPPLTHLEHSLDLWAVVEDVATARDVQVVLEGYGPPGDPRLSTLVVAPDPGVIEVNVHPASSWEELTAITEGVYADARQARLGTETFDLDGSHTGSGGGNHVTLGGATPADSPFLHRPDLLRSLLTYWQRHPSLSYLFSGKFVGPTSQAPRVDEGREESLHELETAFAELDRQQAAHPDGAVPGWILDRALRHLLTDLTGNTHRAEFCIDKLHSPDSERGRLGLLELRAFEMPPHPDMALVQALLVRSLVAMAWSTPITGPLTRWGGLLHDRFMLPWYARADVLEVVADLRDHGIPFEAAWLDPFIEFRFPRLGTAAVGDVEIELRKGVEPWHVLGEEATGSGTARYVDSSVERIQVAVRGATPGRHVLTCNGAPVPVAPTSEAGTLVGAVRFKAWAPPSGLHPTIGVHGPLTFDLVDRWSGRSLGGCRYHVSHQGGRGYDTFPVNALEADARRGSRFEEMGHTPGPVDVAALDRACPPDGGAYPLTLDLRRPRPA